MRTFQYSDAKSHKFWNIDVSGKSFTVTYGKINTAGQTQKKSFPSAEKAQAEADKLIKEKTKKGYVETTAQAVTSDDEAFHRKLEETPYDLAVWSAFADYLTEQGNPRGEFMQVQIALEDETLPKAKRDELKKREKALLKKHERDWLGALAPAILKGRTSSAWDAKKKKSVEVPAVGHTFTRGWLTRLHFLELSVDEARALVKTPEARQLRELFIERYAYESPVGTPDDYIDTHYEPGPDVPEHMESYRGASAHALCRAPQLKNVRVFRFGEPIGFEPIDWADGGFSCHLSGEMMYHLVKQMPQVEELYLLCHRVDKSMASQLLALPMPNLRILQMFHFDAYPLEKLAANKTLTNLEVLACHPHNADHYDDPGAYLRLAQLKALCRANLPKLRHLGLRLTDFGDAGAKEIVSSGVLKRLKVLDLYGGCITDKGAEALAAAADLKNLTMLNLSVNALTEKGIKILQATKVPLLAKGQHTDVAPFDDETPDYLCYGDIE